MQERRQSLVSLRRRHLWHRGWSVLDVTDPEAPELLHFCCGTRKHLDDPNPGRRRQDDHRFGKNRARLGRRRRSTFWTEGFFIFDVSEPTKPRRIGHFQTGSTGTHRNFYDGGNLVHAAAGAPGLKCKILPDRRHRRSGRTKSADSRCRNKLAGYQFPDWGFPATVRRISKATEPIFLTVTVAGLSLT